MKYFWAKTTSEGKPGISVHDHMLNVGHVALRLAGECPAILERLELTPNGVAALAALHDLGKISPGFQRKCEAWLEENNLLNISVRNSWDTCMEEDHGKVTHSAVQTFLIKNGIPRKCAKYLAAILGAHHGRIKYYPNDRGINPPLIIKLVTDTNSGIDWDNARFENAMKIWQHFLVENKFAIAEDSPAIWWLAGLTSVADWIGSDERFFPPDDKAADKDICFLAATALAEIGFRKPEIIQGLSFHDLFHDKTHPQNKWVPNEMQEKTFSQVTGPGVYVVEAPMGMGKTEAALWAAYRLLAENKANGIYFALPTQATSNRIHLRMNDFLSRITPHTETSRLIHGNSWLMDQTTVLTTAATVSSAAGDDARAGRDWFASTKRALLAPFGVGTIDQALLGVVAAKHFFVRHFALAGKVVILDEVHSYDLYTGTLIDNLIATLEGLGCAVIVLSATLSAKRLDQIVPLPDYTDDVTRLPYPLITGRREGDILEPVPASQLESKEISVDFISPDNAVDEVIALAQKGGAVLWICNTVDAAQKQYRQIVKKAKDAFPVGLLHSRFPHWRRQMLEDEWMLRFGKEDEARCGSILISTQVVEQSVDLDADLMITELAPTDMLLQRLGRLWRHKRGNRPAGEARLCIIEEKRSLDVLLSMEAKDIVKTLGSKARVYAPYILLRSLCVWKKQEQVEIPLQIRSLIESTYRDEEDEPDSWQELSLEWFGTDSAKKMMADRNSNFWQLALEDREGVQTRINEVPTISLVLCLSLDKGKALFVDHTSAALEDDVYRLQTAQAIHKNLVKVADYCFEGLEPCSAFKNYLYGAQCAGIVKEDGKVEVKGLRKDTALFYSSELGLVINKSS